MNIYEKNWGIGKKDGVMSMHVQHVYDMYVKVVSCHDMMRLQLDHHLWST